MSVVTHAEALEAVRMLRASVEALADDVQFSETAKNPDGGAHVVIADGAIRPEGEVRQPWPGLDEACIQSLRVAESLRAAQAGSYGAVLYWRIPPELEFDERYGRFGIYMRLSFSAKLNDP